jgi:hypothetical protein
MGKIIDIYRSLTPEFIRDFMYYIRSNSLRIKLDKSKAKKEVLEFIDKLDTKSEEILYVKNYLLKNKIKNIPLDIDSNFEVSKQDGYYYVIFFGKKLFFPKGTTRKSVIRYCKGIIEEQNPLSPHSYLCENFDVENNSIITDIGAAEGNFALSVIDKVKKAYIFESDKKWIDALNLTFEPWKDKVEIINNLVGDFTKGDMIALGDFFKNIDKPNFLKIDVEGYEEKVISGSESFINNDNLKIAICTYHKYNDESKFEKYFKQLGFKTQLSNGYMIMYDNKEDFKKAYLRRGVLRASK